MVEHNRIQTFVIPLLDCIPGFIPIKTTNFFDELKKGVTAVNQMINDTPACLGPHGLNIQTDELSIFTVTIFIKDSHLIKGHP